MDFGSIPFIVWFLPAFLLIYYVIPSDRSRKVVLILGSIGFYAVSYTVWIPHLLALTCLTLLAYQGVQRFGKPVLAAAPLSPSATHTLQLFNQGRDLSTIAHRRRLKVSTAREHLLTAAILTPQGLDWERLLPVSYRQQLAQRYGGPVTSWHFTAWTADSNTDFFYFRLYQIYQGRLQNG